MYNKRNKNLNPGSGFTLIEILIVVVIITVISGAILSLINSEGLRGKSRDAQRVADIKKLKVLWNYILLTTGSTLIHLQINLSWRI